MDPKCHIDIAPNTFSKLNITQIISARFSSTPCGFWPINSKMVDTLRDSLRYQHIYRRKIRFYRELYEFTFGQCGFCVESGCACKDRICQHVEEQAAKQDIRLERTTHALRFIGPKGCIVPPHLRETCTVYLCGQAQKKTDFNHARYEKLKRICARIDWRLMQLEDETEVAFSN
jgi:hypothetical protein